MQYEKEMRQPVARWLQSRGFEVGYELCVGGYADMIGFKFAERIGRPVPKLLSVEVIELKLRDVKRVIEQARTNKYHVTQSWTAMPQEFVERMDGKTLDRFIEVGVGLLAVGEHVEVKIYPTGDDHYGAWLHKKLWRVHRQSEKKRIAEYEALSVEERKALQKREAIATGDKITESIDELIVSVLKEKR